MAVKKAIKVVPIAQEIYDLEETQIEDVEFKLSDIEQITLGESFKIAISIHVSQHTVLIINLPAIVFVSNCFRPTEHVVRTAVNFYRVICVVNIVHWYNGQQIEKKSSEYRPQA